MSEDARKAFLREVVFALVQTGLGESKGSKSVIHLQVNMYYVKENILFFYHIINPIYFNVMNLIELNSFTQDSRFTGQ